MRVYMREREHDHQRPEQPGWPACWRDNNSPLDRLHVHIVPRADYRPGSTTRGKVAIYIYIYEIIINETLKWPSLLPILMQESSWW